MDPHANIEQQRALAADILKLSDLLPTNGVMLDEQAAALLNDATRLAGLVQALDDWRWKGGFDPYGEDE